MANWSALTVQPHTSVASLLDHNRSELISNNRHYIKVVVKVVLFCALQEISLRGHREGESASNKGNFLELMELLSSNDKTLKAQLRALPRNVTYTSHTIQNEVLHTLATKVRSTICFQVNEARYFSILADETRDVSKQEQMSFVIRYVSVSDHSIQERFLTFVHATGLDAPSLTQYIKDTLALYNLNPLCIVSQGYDGTSVMSGKCRRVQTRVREFAPHAVYINCHGHISNLVLVDSIKSINRAAMSFALLQVLYVFISSSKVHEVFLAKQKQLHPSKQPMELQKLSDTHWVARYASVNAVCKTFDSILSVIEEFNDGSDFEKSIEAR
ncbi:PREDICTED: zinc finger MYM-type protein 1-like, partial [Amphimedon queenslandica]